MAELADAPDFGCVTTVHLSPASSRQVKIKSKIEYAPVVKLAYTLDLGCVTTVHLFPASSRQVKIKSKIEYAPVVKLAYTLDFGCVTTVHFSLQALAGKNQSKFEYAGVAELADARDLGSRAARCAGSIPVTRTNEIPRNSEGFFIC